VFARHHSAWARLACALSALLIAALVRPPAASATWGAPFDVSSAGNDGFGPQVAVDADGDAVFTWIGGTASDFRVKARARSTAGALGAVQTLSSTGVADAPQVAVDADGDAVFAWVRHDGVNYRIQARARSATGALGAVQTLSFVGGDANAPRVAVDPNGDAVFTWQRFDGFGTRVQARARSATGVLGPVQTLSRAGRGAHDPRVAVDADGDAVFCWQQFDDFNQFLRVQARARSAAGTLSATQTLSGWRGGGCELAVNAAGDAVFTWEHWDGADDRVQARARSAAGALSAGQTLSPPGQSARLPKLGIDADGDAVFTWLRWNGVNDRVQARARSAPGALSAGQTLSTAGQDAFEPQVAVDADGDAVFSWRQRIGGNERIRARTRSAAGALGAGQTLSRLGQDSRSPDVAVGAAGDAVVAWQRGAFPHLRIQAAAGP
jgi:hypothetical protein